MTNKALPISLLCAVLIGAALFFVRQISPEFGIGSSLYDHPFQAFVAVMMVAGVFWSAFIWLIPKLGEHASAKQILFWGVVFGIGLRAMFLGSTPIYENRKFYILLTRKLLSWRSFKNYPAQTTIFQTQ